MSKMENHLPHGPGGTHWIVSRDDSLSKCRHNDTGWCSSFATADQLTSRNVARMLRDAYLDGMEDGLETVRQVLNVEKKE